MKAIENSKNAFGLFQKYSEYVDCIGNVREEIIRDAEQALAIKFPPSYYLFLLKYGCCGFFASEFYGIMDADFINSSAPDAIWYTLTERKQFQLPHKYIIVGDPGYGPLDAIDTSKPDENGECPVMMIDINDEDPVTKEKEWYEMEQLAPDFGTYLYNQSKQALQNAIDNGDVEG